MVAGLKGASVRLNRIATVYYDAVDADSKRVDMGIFGPVRLLTDQTMSGESSESKPQLGLLLNSRAARKIGKM